MSFMTDPAVVGGLAWFGNISSSVAIIFVNKLLMGRSGFDFTYGDSCWKTLRLEVRSYPPLSFTVDLQLQV